LITLVSLSLDKSLSGITSSSTVQQSVLRKAMIASSSDYLFILRVNRLSC